MKFMDCVLLIATASLCIWAVGHSWMDSFFKRKEELVDRFKTELEKDIHA